MITSADGTLAGPSAGKPIPFGRAGNGESQPVPAPPAARICLNMKSDMN
jgi:hypothetical protein